MTKKAKRDFLKKATKDGIMTNKKFWRTAKPILTNNGCISNDFIRIENEGNLICNEQELVELFNEHYINTRKVLWQKTLVTRKFFRCISR